jgi:Flp pilus assembly protein CpaB
MLERQKLGEMMRERKTLLLALAGGVLGLAASLMAYHYLEREESQLRDKMKEDQDRNQVAVVVAKANLPAGSVVGVNNMATRQVPKDYVYPETILPGDFDKISGQSLVKPLAQGQPLLRGYLSEGGAAGLSDKIKAGRRAIAINVDEVSSLNGLILPGDQIDLMLSSRGSGSVIPLLQGVKVLATGAQIAPRTDAQPGDDKFGLRYATLTLDVAPEDAEKLILARDHGNLTAILRGRKGGDEQIALAPMQAQELFGVPALRGAMGSSITYFVRGPAGVADSFQVPVGMSMPSGGGALSAKGAESRPQAAPDQDKDRKAGEQGKQ